MVLWPMHMIEKSIPQGLKPRIPGELRDPRLKPWGTYKQNGTSHAIA